MSTGVFAFKKVAKETLENRALRACEVILSSGIGIRGGQIVAGGNNVMADDTINAFTDDDLIALRGSDMGELAAMAIEHRKSYINNGHDLLCIKNCVSSMVRMGELGWGADIEITNFDLNAIGEKFDTYVEPEGLVKQLLAAFPDDKTPKILRPAMKV